MRKLKYLVPVLLLCACETHAITSGYIPFHQYVLEHNGNLPKQEGVSRDIGYQLIAYMHIVPSGGNWTYADSGNYFYNNTMWVQSGNTLTFASTDSAWAVNSQFTDSSANFGYLYLSTYQTVANNIPTNNYQYIYGYDANFNQVSVVYQVWNGTAWANSFQYVNTFDANNNQITQTLQTFSGGWQNDSLTTSQYSSSNLDSESIVQYYNGSNWVNAFKYDYNWDANRNNFQTFVYSWNGTAWANYGLINQGFDGSSNRVSYVLQLWNAGAGTYQNSYSEAYTYLLNHVTGYTNYGWNSVNQGWEGGISISYNYDGNFNLVFEQDDSNTVSSGPYGIGQYYYYYDQVIFSGLNQLNDNLSASIFGNPVNNNSVALSVSSGENAFCTIAICDERGKQIRRREQQFTGGTTHINFDVSDLAAGLYFLRIADKNSGAQKTLKFVKQN